MQCAAYKFRRCNCNEKVQWFIASSDELSKSMVSLLVPGILNEIKMLYHANEVNACCVIVSCSCSYVSYYICYEAWQAFQQLNNTFKLFKAAHESTSAQNN